MNVEKFDIKAITSTLRDCFAGKEIEDLARQSKFLQRSTSRLTGQSFLMMNVFDSTSGSERSLTDSCDWLEEHFGVVMTKQSLDERYHTDSVGFIRSCFHRILERVNRALLDSVSLSFPFTRIQLTDSTSFQIPPNLATFYKGYEGNGGPAIIKTHFNYNLLNGSIADIKLTDGASHDCSYKLGASEQIQAGGLYLRDLGYLDLEQFLQLTQEGAYFLSRTKSNMAYSRLKENGKYERIDIADYLPNLGQTKELTDIYVGFARNKVKVRLVMQAVPEKVAFQRLKRLEQYASKHKQSKISEQRKAMCWFNIYMTNANEQMLPAVMIRLVYSLRWQIELIFKIWKSVFKIDEVKKMSIFRFECYMYSKLIAILLTLHIQNKLGQFLWDEYEFELSPIKAAKVVKKNSSA